MIKAQSVLADFDALAKNSLTICSGPNRSSIIVSETWTYFSFRAASAAPATANRLDDIRSALVRPGVASKAPARLMAADHRRYNCTCARTAAPIGPPTRAPVSPPVAPPLISSCVSVQPTGATVRIHSWSGWSSPSHA